MPLAKRPRLVCCCRICKGNHIRDYRTCVAHLELHGKGVGDDGIPNPSLLVELRGNLSTDQAEEDQDNPPYVGDWEPNLAKGEPLWEESGYTDQDISVWLGFLASKYGIPRDAVNDLLHGFKALLEGTENTIPENWNQMFKKLHAYGVPVVVYDVCKDDCIIFRGVHADKMSCPVCNK